MSSKIRTTPTFTAAEAAEMKPFAATDDRWGWAHYGFYVLDLPAPFGYLNANTVIGTAGSHTFNRPAGERKNPSDCRRDASLHVSTGGFDNTLGGWHYSMYDTANPQQASLSEDGSVLSWTHKDGRFTVRQAFPNFYLEGRYRTWSFSLTLITTQTPALVTQFARIKNRYEHFSLMASAHGSFTFLDSSSTQSGTITSPELGWPANIEYARSVTPQMLTPTRLPIEKMVSETMFTYQILTITSPATSPDQDNYQVLLARIGTRKKETISVAWLRSSKFPEKNVGGYMAEMKVLGYKNVPTPNGDEKSAIVPAEIRWTVYQPGAAGEKGQREILMEFTVWLGEGRTGNLWRGKFGAGFNTGCEWKGTYRGRSLGGSERGRGHVEWVDTEVSPNDMNMQRSSGQARL